ncbi:MAG: translation initiation factor IF-3 [Proteobacteria bacterium]|nr:translation initiation factor IF-3 [Pseudomonadota bacterium]
MARPPRHAGPPVREGPRINELITVSSVRLVDAEGEMKGVVPLEEALEHAAQAGLDLVEVSPNADPPVCKILDYGKLKFQEQKKKSEARKKQKIIEIKEIKMRPNIDTHDYDVKMKAIRKFIGEGDKVKVTIRFRGREMAHQELGMRLLNRVREETNEETKVEHEPAMEGRQMIMVLAPSK